MAKFYLSLSRYLTVLLLLVTTMAWSQSRTVTGKVTSSDDGTGLPGVNVIEKGTNNGTATDADGNFSLSVPPTATLVFSFVGYETQEMAVGGQTTVNISLSSDVTSLSEVVVVGYGSQDKKEITSSVVSLSEKEFNRGNVNDPTQLLQGKVPGLSVYNRGGNPNSGSVIRLRGISTVGSNIQPLIVIDGVIGASLDNVDPNDIESINVLKDGSAAAIYGSRGSSGVIIVTTKRGSKSGALSLTYDGYVSAANVWRRQPVMTKSEYVAAGGNDLGSETDWQDEVTRTGISHVHNVALSGGTQATQFRLSTNFRNVEGVLRDSEFDQVNTRANISHSALDNKLKVDLNMALTNRNSNFSFEEALRYAVLFNPTAPIRFDNGEYYQAILFDNYNPVAIINQNTNLGKRKNLNYNAKIDYTFFDALTVTANYGQQYENNLNGSYYRRTSLFRGFDRGGLARRFTSDRSFKLFETYATFSKSLSKVNLDITGGYSFQEDEYEDITVELGNFPSDDLGFNALETSGDRLSGNPNFLNINSNVSPKNQIVAQFGRLNLTFDDAIYFNASIRREGSTKLGKDNRYGIFPAFGIGADLTKYLPIENVNVLKVRVGYGVTGSLPNDAGLAQDQVVYEYGGGGATRVSRNANPDLKWEEKAELNFGIDFAISNKLTGAIDVYNRDIKDFILEQPGDQIDRTLYPEGSRFFNAGSLNTKGFEVSLAYNSLKFGEFSWTPGIVASSYKTVLESFIIDQQQRAGLGSPGQNSTNLIRVKVGEEIGQIWGPVFDGVEGNGSPRFKDINNDGQVISAQGEFLNPNADFRELGNGIPSFELGWTNQVTFKKWDFNAFFRGAFGHSLVNSYRAFYEPIDLGAINSYNRIKTDKAVDGLSVAQFSSLYVEKADFFKLDNATIGYTVNTNKAISRLRFYASVQNAFMFTNYTGIDPEPALVDPEPDTDDVLAPGVDRRNTYFSARTFTFGVNIGL